MKARQSPLSKFESFLERIVQAPFNRLFPSRIEPIELTHKLERTMDDNVVIRNDGRLIVPIAYDIHLSIKDHQYLAPNQGMLIRDWQEQLIDYARHRQYFLSDTPILRLHADTSLKMGQTRIETAGEDAAGHMATQALSAEQLAKLWEQQAAAAPPAQPTNQPSYGGYQGNTPTAPPMAPALPFAQLTINLPQGGQRIYRIEKAVVSIGRQLDNDIIVEDKRVGRYHAQIKYDGQNFVLYDLGSTNGTLVNRMSGIRQHALRNGDVFTIGGYDFQFLRR